MRGNADLSPRLRDQFLDLAGRVPPAAGCPEPQAIWSAAARELQPVDVSRLLDHASACADCLQDWRLAREVIAGSGLAPAPVAAVAPPRARWALWGSLAAAGAAVILLAIVIPRTTLTPQAPAFRGKSGVITSLLSPDQTLHKDQAVLRWSGGPDGTLYTVEVVDEKLDLVASGSESAATSFQIPAEALAPLSPGTRLLWRVKARLPDGSRVGSPTFSIVVE